MISSVYVWCPAFALADVAQLQRTTLEARWLAETIGLKLDLSPRLQSLGNPERWLDSEERIAECESALEHRVLIAARGGYGCIDLAPMLLASSRKKAGTLIGYSDLTVLHCCWLQKKWGESLYGFCAGVPHGERARSSTSTLLAGNGLRLDSVTDPTVRTRVDGEGRGICFAACLRVLASLVGTPAMPKLDGCILALEDIDERPYQIDRDLQQLNAAGALDGVRGLIFGRFPSTLPDGYSGPSLDTVCSRWARHLRIPAIVGLPFGHDPDPLTLPCGRPTVLSVSEQRWSLEIAKRRE